MEAAGLQNLAWTWVRFPDGVLNIKKYETIIWQALGNKT
jgi:hypothetical protein